MSTFAECRARLRYVYSPCCSCVVIVDLALKGFLVGRRECKLCAAVIAVVDLCIAANQFVALLRQPVLQTDRESALQYYTGWEYLAYTTLALDHFPVVEVTIQSRSS